MKIATKMILVLLSVAISGCGHKIVKSSVQPIISPVEMGELKALPKGQKFSELSPEDAAKVLKLARKSIESVFKVENVKPLCLGQPDEKACIQTMDAAIRKLPDMLAADERLKDLLKDESPIDVAEMMHAASVGLNTILLNLEWMRNITDEDEAIKLGNEMASDIKAKVMADLKIDEARFKELDAIGKKFTEKIKKTLGI